MGDKTFSGLATQFTVPAQVADVDVLGLDDISATATVGLPMSVLALYVLNSKALPTGVIIGTTDTQTLTNKTIDGDLNTITDISTVTGLKDVALTAAECNVLDGAVAGTVGASKAVIADANTNLGIVKATTLYLGATTGTEVTATATELNKVDGVASQIEGSDERIGQLYGGALTIANAVLTGSTFLRCNSAGGAFQITLPEIDKEKIYKVHVVVETGGNDVTIIDNGSDAGFIKADLTTKYATSLVIDTAGDYVILESSGCATGYWSIIGGNGIVGA